MRRKHKIAQMDVALLYRKTTEDAVAPSKATPGSWGFDIASNKTVTIKPGEIVLVPTGLIVKRIFHHSMIALVPRSSLAIKKKLIFPHSIGIIDDDYCGEEDELKVPLLNISDKPVTINKGERIAQIIVFKVVSGEAVYFPKPFKDTSRGGFGSTGGYTTEKQDH